MDKDEIKKNLYEADSPKEIQEILSGLGFESSDEEAARLFEEIQLFHSSETEVLSEDELAAISGGRDYAKDGCAATVEPGSDCWGEDGGCAVIHYHYDNRPLRLYCKKDGTPLYKFECPPEDLFAYKYRCRVCGAEYTDFDFIPD